MTAADDPVSDRCAFAQLIEDLRYPPAKCGRLPIGSRDDWRRAFPRLSAVERRELLKAPSVRFRLLTATTEGRMRLRAWLQHPIHLPVRPAERLAWIWERARVFGDSAFVPIVADALTALPDCVVAAVVAEVAFVAVGCDSVAWFASAALDRPHLIALGPHADAHVVRHEVGHAWHGPLPSAERPGAITAVGEAGLQAHAVASGWAGRFDDAVSAAERVAEAVAVGFGR